MACRFTGSAMASVSRATTTDGAIAARTGHVVFDQLSDRADLPRPSSHRALTQ
jgi:hypothetical protein